MGCAVWFLVVAVSLGLTGAGPAEAEPFGDSPLVNVAYPNGGGSYLVNSSIHFFADAWDNEGRIDNYAWTIDRDGLFWGGNASGGEEYEAFFDREGQYNITVEVTDNHGLTSSDWMHFEIIDTANAPPVPIINSPADNATIYDDVTGYFFNASGSYDPGGNIDRYDWFVSGWGAFSSDNPVCYRPMQIDYTAQHTVYLNVQDWRGLANWTSTTVNFVCNNTRPVAVISEPKRNQTFPANTSIHFNSNGSYDPDGFLVSYNWQILGEPYNTTVIPGPECNMTFYTEKIWIIGLDVVDNGGKTGETFVTIEIRGQPAPPELNVTIDSPSNGSKYLVGQNIPFVAQVDSPDDWSNFTFGWDFGDRTTAGGYTAIHSYSSAGTYAVRLSVARNGSEATCFVFVSVDRANSPPSPKITVNGSGPAYPAGYPVYFSSAGTTDPDGDPLNLLWYVSSEPAGNFSTILVGNGSDMTHTFDLPGNYTVILSVSDGRSTSSDEVNVSIYSRPQATIQLMDEQKNATIQNGELFVGSGRSISLEGNDSVGPNPLTHYWDFGDGTTATGQVVNHTYARPGTYTITCAVSDGYVNTTVRMNVNVMAGHPVRTSTPSCATYALAAGIVLLVVGLGYFFGGTEVGLGVVFPLLVFLYSKIKREEILDNYLRGRISGYIVANPGDHYTSIRDALKLSNGTLAFHIRKLESEGVIKSRIEGTFKRFYPGGMRVPEPNGGSLTQVQKMVFDKILETPGISQKDIAGILNISTKTVGYHIEALLRKGVIRKQRAGMRVRLFAEETAFSDAEGHGG